MSELKITIHPDRRFIGAVKGETFKSALDREGYYFPQTCDGKGKCGFCRIRFLVSPPKLHKREVELLGGETPYRLACLHRVEGDCEFFLPAVQEWLGDKTIIGFKAPAGAEGYAIAGDIGTTTVALYLLNLKSGEIAGQYSFLNPQSPMGGEVMTRLEIAKESSGRIRLHRAINRGISDGIDFLLSQNGVARSEIVKVTLAGNTAMTHLFMGWGGEGLERAPFRSPLQKRGYIPFRGEDIGLGRSCVCEFMPIISGFIGSDTTAAIIASDMEHRPGKRLLLDLGTNGEIVFSDGRNLWAVSAAAGPAFEGVGMHSGMPALKGAIEGISSQGMFQVLGQGEPVGFCGSGYIACIAYLLQIGRLSPSGLLRPNEEGERKWRPEPCLNPEIALTQEDIRKFQLAKGAIGAGVEILLAETGNEAKDLAEIILTGSFGNRIDPVAAVEIGLLPDIPPERVVFLDNAAGRGAMLCLSGGHFQERALRLQRVVKTINLAEHPKFQEIFVKNMSFPRQVCSITMRENA